MERPDRPRPTRLGFTLVELLIAILIIGALLAILLPTIAAAFRKAKEATVAAEMNNLATALASFKNTYGDYPPSRVLLSEVGYAPTLLNDVSPLNSHPQIASIPSGDTNDSDLTVGALAQRSLTYLRKFWPRANYASVNTSAAVFNDFNGNSSRESVYYILSGSECLTFFLGGIPINSGGNITGLSGFSRSPTNPFVSSNAQGAQNRTTPNYEFVNGRLRDQDGDGIPSYFDPIDQTPGNRRPYAYFSAYGNNQYDPNDVNGYGRTNIASEAYELVDDPDPANLGKMYPVERGFTVSFPTVTSNGTVTNYAFSPAPNPYTNGPAAFSGTVSWYNANSFQLLCAGVDREWGLGGTYMQSGTGSSNLPLSSSDPGLMHPSDADGASPNSGVRARESDNITNFSGGRLQ